MDNISALGKPLIGEWDIHQNFWDYNKWMIKFEPFKTFRKIDKTQLHRVSGDEMWAIALINDYESPLIRLPKSERILKVEVEYLERSQGWYNKNAEKRLKDVINAYNKLQEESPYRNMINYLSNLDKVGEKVSSLIESDSIAVLQEAVTLMAAIPKVYANLELEKNRLKRQLDGRILENKNRSNADSSLLEDEKESNTFDEAITIDLKAERNE